MRTHLVQKRGDPALLAGAAPVHVAGQQVVALVAVVRAVDAAQPVTTTYADYLLPTATEVPMLHTLYRETPSPLNPLGVKGVGEAGTIPAAAAIVSAVEDALSPFNVRVAQYPITPMTLVELIEAGGG